MAIPLAVAGLAIPFTTNAASYEYVGFFHVGDGPRWTDNPDTYTGQEAAALIFGGDPSDFAISTVSDNPDEIDFLAYLDGWGDTQYLSDPQPQDWDLDLGDPGYAEPGGMGSSYSAYVDDHSCPTSCINYVFRVINYDLAQAYSSLLSTDVAIQSALSTSNTLVNGAHSRPMSRRVAEGEKTFWVAGDWGNDNHDERDGSTGLAEIGFGYNFGPAQINVSMGKTWADQDMKFNGDLDIDGRYLMVEGILPVSEEQGVYATLGGLSSLGRCGYSPGLPCWRER